MIKAIETHYKGYRFRSRLEARWAVFFDALGIDWKYEDQGYEREYEDGLIDRYLPDFVIPAKYPGFPTFFVEVKGDSLSLAREYDKHQDRHDFGGILPNFGESADHNLTGLVLLGEVPNPGMSIQIHPIIQHSSGIIKKWCLFTPNGKIAVIGENVISRILDVAPECINGDPDGWIVETKNIVLGNGLHYKKVNQAYLQARSARFEHGENGSRAA